MNIVQQLPALQVLIPFFGALFAALSFRVRIAQIVAIVTSIIAFILSVYGTNITTNNSISYAFGDWPAPIGVEYRLDYLNQPAITYINGVLLFFLVCCQKLIVNSVLKYININKQHLFYSIILFAHAGYLGMVSTNDLFNLYVFMEISSLSAYILMSQGNNAKAVVGAFDYLVLGTIGATLILIGIGFLLSATGSLNITDIASRLQDGYHSNFVTTGISFVLIGSILKLAFFPMHFWMIRAYNAAPSIILVYLASISAIIGTYILVRFINFTIDYSQIETGMRLFLKIPALITIIVCSALACLQSNIKKIIIYSSATQIGYVFLLLSVGEMGETLSQFLLADGINKIALFLIYAYFEARSVDLNSNLFKTFAIINLICSSSLPLSGMFFIKLNMLDLLWNQNYLPEFISVIASSAIALFYHFKIARILFLENDNYKMELPLFKITPLIIITFLQFLILKWTVS